MITRILGSVTSSKLFTDFHSVSDQKLLAFGAEWNFWRADQASGGGLCGPSTEIHIDFAALSGRRDLNCARCMVNSGGARIVELWNCVFITHRMVEETGFRSVPLPLSCFSVDTGMGLERLTSVMQVCILSTSTVACACIVLRSFIVKALYPVDSLLSAVFYFRVQ